MKEVQKQASEHREYCQQKVEEKRAGQWKVTKKDAALIIKLSEKQEKCTNAQIPPKCVFKQTNEQLGA